MRCVAQCRNVETAAPLTAARMPVMALADPNLVQVYTAKASAHISLHAS